MAIPELFLGRCLAQPQQTNARHCTLVETKRAQGTPGALGVLARWVPHLEVLKPTELFGRDGALDVEVSDVDIRHKAGATQNVSGLYGVAAASCNRHATALAFNAPRADPRQYISRKHPPMLDKYAGAGHAADGIGLVCRLGQVTWAHLCDRSLPTMSCHRRGCSCHRDCCCS